MKEHRLLGEDANRTIALIGSNGMLATMLKRVFPASWEIHAFDLPEFDITGAAQVREVMAQLRPDVIINCAAFTKVDLCESEQETAFKVNGQGPGNLAEAAHQVGAVLVHISTDFVFAGDKTTPYTEDDAVGPQSVYGRSKLEGEVAIIDSPLERYYIVRTSWLYGPGGPNFVETIARLAAEREELGIVADQHGTPTFTGDLAEAIIRLLALEATPHPSPLTPQNPYGLYHFSNEGECTWYDFACEIVTQLRERGAGLKAKTIKPLRTEEFPVPAKRPSYSVLSKEKYKRTTGTKVPEWKRSLRKYFDNRT
ncbi:MAG: dTDP-4-dehydrorhamnose reductase [Desulfuromonadales bacterium]|nr:dTDP-4-dehydrorhamnose reductase [Desulfuromonadales bacterium]MDW7756477.1 dTDP-4-dehydrorhamnose reductase [Desulfuromonadales bacterium]